MNIGTLLELVGDHDPAWVLEALKEKERRDSGNEAPDIMIANLNRLLGIHETEKTPEDEKILCLFDFREIVATMNHWPGLANSPLFKRETQEIGQEWI
jgi:hypothetical protein